MINEPHDFKILNQWKERGHGALSEPQDFSDYVISFSIDRRNGTNVGEAHLICDNISYPERDRQLLVRYAIKNSGHVMTDTVNKMQIFIDDMIQFTGWVTDYKIGHDNQITEISLMDNIFLLKRGIILKDKVKVNYKNIDSIDFIQAVANLVNCTLSVDKEVLVNRYKIKEIEIENGANAFDLITQVCDCMNSKIFAEKDGTLKVKIMHKEWNNTELDWEYNEVSHIQSSNTNINIAVLKPAMIVKNNADKMFMFTDTLMLYYLNAHNDVETVENDFVNSVDTALNVAKIKYLEMWKKSSTQDIIAAFGNPRLDLGQIIRTNIGENIDYFVVQGITIEYTSDKGYIDKIDIECVKTTEETKIEYNGVLLDYVSLSKKITKQARKYVNIPWQTNAYYRKDLGEWGICSNGLITKVLADIGMKTIDNLTADIEQIKTWCVSIDKQTLREGDIVVFQSKIGFYLGNNKVVYVNTGRVRNSATPKMMLKLGYKVKTEEIKDINKITESYRLRGLA